MFYSGRSGRTGSVQKHTRAYATVHLRRPGCGRPGGKDRTDIPGVGRRRQRGKSCFICFCFRTFSRTIAPVRPCPLWAHTPVSMSAGTPPVTWRGSMRTVPTIHSSVSSAFGIRAQNRDSREECHPNVEPLNVAMLLRRFTGSPRPAAETCTKASADRRPETETLFSCPCKTRRQMQNRKGRQPQHFGLPYLTSAAFVLRPGPSRCGRRHQRGKSCLLWFCFRTFWRTTTPVPSRPCLSADTTAWMSARTPPVTLRG